MQYACFLLLFVCLFFTQPYFLQNWQMLDHSVMRNSKTLVSCFLKLTNADGTHFPSFFLSFSHKGALYMLQPSVTLILILYQWSLTDKSLYTQ